VETNLEESDKMTLASFQKAADVNPCATRVTICAHARVIARLIDSEIKVNREE